MSCMDGCRIVVGCALSGRMWWTVGEKTSQPMGVVILALTLCRFSTVFSFWMFPLAFVRVRSLSMAVRHANNSKPTGHQIH